MRAPFPTGSPRHPQYVLLELSVNESEQHAVTLLETLMQRTIGDGIIDDAVVAASLAQSRALWQMREHIPLGQAAEGKNIKHDISLPISCIADFIAATDALLQAAFPACRWVCFGHVGDGNLHYNAAPPDGVAADTFILVQSTSNRPAPRVKRNWPPTSKNAPKPQPKPTAPPKNAKTSPCAKNGQKKTSPKPAA